MQVHKYYVFEEYADGTMLLKCNECSASVLYKTEPFLHKMLNWGDTTVQHVYTVSGIPGIELNMDGDTK